MKFPFDFSIVLVFRMLFPGAVLAAAYSPLLLTLAWKFGYQPDLMVAFPIQAVVWGWLIVLCDQPIYMLYEGRRYWPNFLWRMSRGREEARLRDLEAGAADAMQKTDPRRYLESNIALLAFPLDEKNQPVAAYPTRLGNLLRAYETYPNRVYKLDPIFYWYRLWLVLDKDLREELDQAQALADSALYVSAAFALSVPVVLLYAVVSSVSYVDFLYVPASPFALLRIAVAATVFSYACYRLSYYPHVQYGELFKGLFDQYRDKLTFVDDAVELAEAAGADKANASVEKYRIASRFLRWNRIRPPGETRNYTPQEWQAELARRAAMPPPASSQSNSP